MWTIAQRAAYINSQSACMLTEMAAMNAENATRMQCGMAVAYGEKQFMALIDKYGLGCNTVVAFLQEVQQ